MKQVLLCSMLPAISNLNSFRLEQLNNGTGTYLVAIGVTCVHHKNQTYSVASVQPGQDRLNAWEFRELWISNVICIGAEIKSSVSDMYLIAYTLWKNNFIASELLPTVHEQILQQPDTAESNSVCMSPYRIAVHCAQCGARIENFACCKLLLKWQCHEIFGHFFI